MGEDAGEPAVAPVAFGSIELEPVEFERLLEEVRAEQSGASMGGSGASASGAFLAALPRGAYVVEPAGGPEPAREASAFRAERPEEARGAAAALDWGARQIAAVVSGKRLFVRDHFRLGAWSRESGREEWVKKLDGPGRSFPPVPLRPVASGARVLTRGPGPKGPELISIDATSGRELWRQRAGGHVVSDPILISEELYALVADVLHDRSLELFLTTFDLDSGEVLTRRPLLQFRDAWERRLSCQAAAVGDKIVASAGGAVFCSNLLGQVLWVRKEVWLPPSLDVLPSEACHRPPLIAGGRVYAAQPRVAAVECIALESGRLSWRQVIPDLIGVAGVAGETLVVERAGGLSAFDGETGRPLWRRDAEMLGAQAGSSAGSVFLASRQEGADGPEIRFTWLDPASGRTQATSVLQGVDGKDLALGPLEVAGEEIGALMGSRERDASRRRLVRLRRSGDAAAPLAALPGSGAGPGAGGIGRWLRDERP
jgi:outer membrane protein assembly factor BamB